MIGIAINWSLAAFVTVIASKVELGLVSTVLVLGNVVGYVITFVKARRQMRSSPSEGNRNATEERKRCMKEMRLMRIFCIMLLSFTVGFAPAGTLTFLNEADIEYDESLYNIAVTLFGASSVVNPLVTLCLRKEFRLNVKCTKQRRQVELPGATDTGTRL